MNGGKRWKPTSMFWAAFNCMAGLVTLAAWFGITPELVGEVAYRFIHPVLPMAMFFIGMSAGYFIRDNMRRKDLALAAEEERRAEAEKAEIAAYKAELEMVAVLKGYSIKAKSAACAAFDGGSYRSDVDHREGTDACSTQIATIMDCETLPDGAFRYTLKPAIAALLEKYPEVLDPMRQHTVNSAGCAK